MCDFIQTIHAEPIRDNLPKAVSYCSKFYDNLYARQIRDEYYLYNQFPITDAEKECQALIGAKLALPAYDQCIKASHSFNLLDARGVISVTERASYIARVRALAKSCCEAWLANEYQRT